MKKPGHGPGSGLVSLFGLLRPQHAPQRNLSGECILLNLVLENVFQRLIPERRQQDQRQPAGVHNRVVEVAFELARLQHVRRAPDDLSELFRFEILFVVVVYAYGAKDAERVVDGASQVLDAVIADRVGWAAVLFNELVKVFADEGVFAHLKRPFCGELRRFKFYGLQYSPRKRKISAKTRINVQGSCQKIGECAAILLMEIWLHCP